MRRLFALLGLLALVFILIQKTGDVRQVEKVGRAIGLFPASGTQQRPEERPRFDSLSPATTDLTPKVASDFERLQLQSIDPLQQARIGIFSAILSDCPIQVLDELARLEFANSSSPLQGPEVQKWFNDSLLRLEQWENLLSSDYEGDVQRDTKNEIDLSLEKDLLQGILRFQKLNASLHADSQQADSEPIDVSKSVDENITPASESIRNAWRIALDRKLLAGFKDNVIWFSTEQLPSLRLWKRIEELKKGLNDQMLLASDLPKLEGYLLRSQSAADLRGTPMRFRGVVKRIDEREGKLKRDGWPEIRYRVLWIQPAEMTSQPVSVYVPNTELADHVELKLESTVEVIGMFCKRLAYQSQGGPEVAPVLFAAHLTLSPAEEIYSNGSFARWLHGLPPQKEWVPPRDLNALYVAMMQALRASLDTLEASNETREEGPLEDSIFSVLADLLRIDALVQQLVMERATWPLTQRSVLESKSGWVKSIQKISLAEMNAASEPGAPGLASLLRANKSSVYRLDFSASKTSDNGISEDSAVIYTAQVPHRWTAGLENSERELMQPARCEGVFLSVLSGKSVIICDRVHWQVSPTAKEQLDASTWKPLLTQEELRLIQMGWDLSFVDMLSDLQSPIRSLTTEELPALYSLLQMESNSSQVQPASSGTQPNVEIVAPEQASPAVLQPTSVIDLLKASLSKQSGSRPKPVMAWTEFTGRILRITKIPVEDEAQQRWLGQPSYYQLDCSASIGDTTLEIATGNEPIYYRHEYPVTCLVTHLPPWIGDRKSPDQEFSIREELEKNLVSHPRLWMRGSGWHYRFWSYKTEEITRSLGAANRQIVPLIVASELNPKEFQDASTPFLEDKRGGWISWVLPIAALLVLWYFLRKQSGRIQRRTLQ